MDVEYYHYFFCMYVELLAQWIRKTDTIKGITTEHQIALYADDLLIYLTQLFSFKTT